MGDHLAVVAHALDPVLFSPGPTTAIGALARRLPAYSVGGFECRLAAHASRVDLHAFLPATAVLLPEGCDEHAAWQPLRRLADGCADPGSLFHHRILSFILELDVSSSGSDLPAPSLFVALHRRPLPGADLVLAIFRELARATPLVDVEPSLANCLEHLPPGAFVNHVGAMLPRSPPVVRINVGGMRPEGLARYLARLGWAGDLGALAAVAAGLGPLTDSLDLALDVSVPGPAVALGLECFVSSQPADDEGWRSLLDHLVAGGLCAPEKAEALLRWPGIDRMEDAAAWPASLTVAQRFLPPGTLSFFVRRLNHVKVAFDGSALREAKAYLLFGHQWLNLSHAASGG